MFLTPSNFKMRDAQMVIDMPPLQAKKATVAIGVFAKMSAKNSGFGLNSSFRVPESDA